MIYFLVNNNYQYLEARRLAGELGEGGQACALIAVPHTLTEQVDTALFRLVVTLRPPALRSWLSAWSGYLTIGRRVREALAPMAADALFLFTEFELLNQLVAHHFARHGARVSLIEDGGVGTYIPLTLSRPEPQTLKDRVYRLMVRAIPRLGRTHFTKFDGINFPMLDNRVLDAVCAYRPLRINRPIPVHVIQRPSQPSVDTVKGRVVFLNQPLYSEHIQSESDYAAGLRLILSALSKGFDEVLFKFHPREPAEWRARIQAEVIGEFPRVTVMRENEPFEAMVSHVRPEAVASYNSTPLLNLAGSGIEPLFIYHLLEGLREAPSFAAMHSLLEAWGYRFAADWSAVASGYTAGEAFDRVQDATPLSDFVQQLSGTPPPRAQRRHVLS